MSLDRSLKNDIRYRIFFFTAILVIFFLRLNVTTKGHMHFPDELRYRYAFTAIDEIKSGNARLGLSYFFRAYCRPAFVMMGVLPASVQRMISPDVGKGDLVDVEKDDLRTYIVPSIFNVFASLGIIALFYLMLRYITKDRFISFAGMIFFSFTNTSYMEIRHMTPYYWAMLLFMLLIYQFLKEKNAEALTAKSLMYYGALSGLGFSIYPGYYNLAFIVAGLVFFISENKKRAFLIFALSFLIFPAVFEIISQYAQLANFGDKGQLKCIYDALPTNPAAKWDFVWIIKYALGIEGIPGLIMLVLTFIFLVKILPGDKIDMKVKLIYILNIAVYIFIITMIYLMGKFTIRIKYCYPFFFFMGIASFTALYHMKGFAKPLVFAILAVSMASFIFYYGRYISAVYPRDVRQYVRETYPDKSIIHTAEFYSKSMQAAALMVARENGIDFLGVNLRMCSGSGEAGGMINIDQKYEIISYPAPENVFTPYSVAAMNFGPIDENTNRMRVYKLK